MLAGMWLFHTKSNGYELIKCRFLRFVVFKHVVNERKGRVPFNCFDIITYKENGIDFIKVNCCRN